ncbi:DUF1566 domain-containing protein [Crenothrix sp.]|uniref:Lcl C-terminal domain-containing protein n=1 Tax=Crenothrix sp. TaxID=3100433 RepID=UPI00374CBC30
MSNPKQTTALSCLLVLLPLLGNAQTCKPQSISATTPTARFTSSNSGWMLDKYTGLMWKTCSEGQVWNSGTHACDYTVDTFTWQGALQQAQKLNAIGGFAKFKDWRIPNQKELYTLVEIQCYSPAINLKVFPNTGTNAFVWSSSASPDYNPPAWIVGFSDGSFSLQDKSYSGQVRLVRAGQ